MALVTGPLGSFSASGMLGDTIVFTCGKIVRKAPIKPTTRSEAQQDNQNLWQYASEVWSQKPEEEKQAWTDFYVWVKKMKCGKEIDNFSLNGFKAWMRFLIKLGYAGWPSFPMPPGLSPEYPKNYWIEYF